MNRQELYLKALDIVSNEKGDSAQEKINKMMLDNPDHAEMLESVLDTIEDSEDSDVSWRFARTGGRLSMSKDENGEFVNKRIFEALGFDAEAHLSEKPRQGFVGKIVAEVDSFVDQGKKYAVFEWTEGFGGVVKQAVYNKDRFVIHEAYDDYDEDDESSYEESYSYDDES